MSLPAPFREAAPAQAADAAFMERALELAARGRALASPNPQVGAVVVREGRVIGEGFHVYEDKHHAEIVALAAAGSAARGATLYVNLEPCCHIGRTGPCTQAIAAAGIARVVTAMRDPNPLVAGRGLDELRTAGIEVSVGLGEAAARKLNEAFAWWIRSRRPLITLKSAMTLDGRLSLRQPARRRNLEERWISSAESRAEVQQMRHGSDALLTGIGTVLSDDPLLTDRTGLPRRRKLLRVILDSRLRLPPRSQLVRSAQGDVLVFTRAREDSPKARGLRRAGIEVIRVGGRVGGRGARPDLRAVAAELGRREILGLLLEAGPALNTAALRAGIVDKMRMFIAPKVAGFAGAHSSAMPGLAAAQALRDVTMERFGPDFAIEGYLRDVYGTD